MNSSSENSNDELETVFEHHGDLFELSLKITNDRLKLFIDCNRTEAAKGNKIELDAFKGILSQLVKQDQLNQAVLNDILKIINLGKVVSKRRLAQGIPAIEGKDGYIEFLVEKVIPSTTANGGQSLDTRFVKLIQNINKDQVVAKVMPPTPGTTGINALGEVIKVKEGQPVKAKFDKSIISRVSMEDPSIEELVATIHGYLTEESGILKIKQELVVNGDIDITSGNVKFVGKVIIQGDVKKNFNVVGDDGIEIEGNVHGSSLTSNKGSIAVKGFVAGGPEYKINAHGDFTARLLQNVFAEADGNIIVHKEARDSNLKTDGAILMTEGHLFGCNVSAVKGVEANIIGSPAESKTNINFGGTTKSRKEHLSLTEQLTTHEQAIKQIREMLGPVANDNSKIKHLPAAAKLQFENLITKLKQLEESHKSIVDRLNTLTADQDDLSIFRVNFHNILHKGVSVKIEDNLHICEMDTQGPGSLEFNRNNRVFEIAKLKPLQGLAKKNK